MSEASQIIVLAEDQRHQEFVRKFLYRKGFRNHDIRMEALPRGRGCGEQWVRERYARAVSAYRQRSSKAKTALVVAIDADTELVNRRGRQLQDALELAGLPGRTDTEAIVHLIPKRHIETWILFLTGRSVDEDTDCRDSNMDGLINGAANRFLELSRVNSPDTIASLSVAILEIRRLD